MTDLVARYWQRSLDGDSFAYCHIGMPDLSLDHRRLLLMHLATTTPTEAQDWRYFGKHAVPLVLHSWVKSANYWMKHKHSGSQQDVVITNMQMHIPALCESWETEASFCMHVLLPALCRLLCESHCSCKQTANMLACMLLWMLFTNKKCEVCDAWQASDFILKLAHQGCDIATNNAVHAANDLAAAPANPFLYFSTIIRHPPYATQMSLDLYLPNND